MALTSDMVTLVSPAYRLFHKKMRRRTVDTTVLVRLIIVIDTGGWLAGYCRLEPQWFLP